MKSSGWGGAYAHGDIATSSIRFKSAKVPDISGNRLAKGINSAFLRRALQSFNITRQ
jgi:hypothetical protein